MIRRILRSLKIVKVLSIKKNHLVLEIGSGANPLLRSDVCMDKYPFVTKKHRTSLLHINVDERPFIVGDAQSLPFLNNSFDFIIARHVLEHLVHPDKFIAEIKRVGKAGYIASPSPFIEILHGGFQHCAENIPEDIISELHHGTGTPGHKWFIAGKKNTIFMAAKSKNIYSIYLLLGYFIKKRTKYSKRSFSKKNRGWMETIIFWENDSINLFILNDIDEEHKLDEKIDVSAYIKGLGSVEKKDTLKKRMKSILRKQIFATKKKYEIYELLACPICNRNIKKNNGYLVCEACGKFPVVNNIPILLPEALMK
ncbi:MAG: methyltransferase domain-containing protein [Candidatus Aminicenantes bacterium]|nr:MAG: methyltransferase domain-containing protein [Candidatus Aminicenantes bacterium]